MPTDNEYLRLIYMTVGKAGGQPVTGSVALDNATLTALADAIAAALGGGGDGTSLSNATITALSDAIATALGGGGGAGGLGLSSVTITALSNAIATALGGGGGSGGLSLSATTLAALESISLNSATVTALGAAIAAALGGTAAKNPTTDVGEWFAKSRQVQMIGTSYSGWVVPYGREWKIQAVYGRFQTTTGVARVPRLVIIPAFSPLVPANEILQQPMLSFPSWGQNAETSLYYQWGATLPTVENAGVASVGILPVTLPSASGIFVNEQLGVDPEGDIWEDIRLFYEERSVDLTGITQW